MANVKGKDNYVVMPQINSVDIVPSGGTDGQVLTKTNATNYNYAWQTIDVNSRYWTGNIVPASGTSTIPWNNSVPLISAGTQLMAQVITPPSTTARYRFQCFANVDSNANNRYVTFALFRGNTCIATTPIYVRDNSRIYFGGITCVDLPATTSPVTYSLRVGINASTWFLNSSNSGNNLGGTMTSPWFIAELL